MVDPSCRPQTPTYEVGVRQITKFKTRPRLHHAVLGGTILFESLWHHGAYGIKEHINPKILAGCLRNRRSELTNSTIKNIVNSVIYRTKESSHDHYSQ